MPGPSPYRGPSIYQESDAGKQIWKNLGQFVQQDFSNLGDATSQLFGLGQYANTSYVPHAPGQPMPPNYSGSPDDRMPTYYQVSKDDKSLMDVSNKTGAPVDHLAGLNNTKTLPPAGSYIQLKPEQLMSQGVPPGVANMIAGQSARLAKSAITMNGDGRGDPAAQALRVQAQDIAKQLANNQLPNSIPAGVLGFLKDASGVPLTIKDFLAEGYVMNSQGILIRGGTPGAQPTTTNNWNTNPALNLITWNKNAKNKHSTFQTTEKWARNAMRRKRRGGGGPAAVAAPTTTEGPSTILDIHLGSG